MRPYCENTRLYLKVSIATLLAVFATTMAIAQEKDLLIGVTYVCSGERMFIENCNIRDTSDNANCMVGHPDHVLANGLMQYTNMTRGELKKLFPTCTQPSAQEISRAQARQKKQQDIYNANVQKAEEQMRAPAQTGGYGPPQPSKDPETRAMNRCITAGRPPSSCLGNSLLGHFDQMINTFVQVTKDPEPGPMLLGSFGGAGNWRIEFQPDGNVLMNCSILHPNGHTYNVAFRNNRAIVTVDSTPKPIVLSLRGNDSLVGSGPIQVEGPVGSSGGGGGGPDYQYRDSNGVLISNSNAASSAGPVYDSSGNRVYGSINTGGGGGHTVYRIANCATPNLSSKGAGTGIQEAQIGMLKGMVGGDDGPAPPPGLRMHGIFAAPTGFSVQFFPESVILGCGPDAARAYPYTVIADGTKAVVEVNAPDHPLTLAFKADGTLDPGGSGPYQVHGRYISGKGNNDDYTFGPMERTCNLAVLSPSKTIPSGGGVAATMIASAGNAPAGTANGGGSLSTPSATLGNATLSITSGFPAQQGVPNPLAGRPYVLLRDSYANAIAKAGVTVPPGMSPYKYVGTACGGPTRTPDCQKIMDAIKASAASAVRADANGSGTFPGVAPGTYYLMISTRYNNQGLAWGQAVQLKPGPNSVALDLRNATPVN